MSIHRRHVNRALVAAVLAGTSIAGCSKVEPEPEPATPPYDEKADARAGLNRALERARSENKRVLVVFGANWCADCRSLAVKMAKGSLARHVNESYVVTKVDVGESDDAVDEAPDGLVHWQVLRRCAGQQIGQLGVAEEVAIGRPWPVSGHCHRAATAERPAAASWPRVPSRSNSRRIDSTMSSPTGTRGGRGGPTSKPSARNAAFGPSAETRRPRPITSVTRSTWR
jgi:thiol-disulfide isomerase/thioredoxin